MIAFLSKASPFLPKLYPTLPPALSPRTRAAQPTRHNYLRCHVTVSNQTNPKRQTPETAKVASLVDAGLAVVVLKRGKVRLFRDLRNSMVFGGAVERCIHLPGATIKSCDPVAVVDGAMECIGYGFYNEHSMFRVRLLRHDSVGLPWDYTHDIRNRLREAVQLRTLLGLPCDGTNIYRILNGEGDRISGLVIDRVGECIVVSSSALWCEQYRREIEEALGDVLPNFEVIWRRNADRLRQDGLVIESTSDKQVEEEEEDNTAPSIATENGVRFEISRYALQRGQKTGHYADQRENRRFVRELVTRGGVKRVLDLFCYTGGFGLNAALGGATVTAVDSSGVAIEAGRGNAKLNGVEERMEFVQEDVTNFLRRSNEVYDIVIVDPPKYAPTKGALTKALRKYRSLNEMAVKRVRPGGLLISCSCSGAVTREQGLFVDTVREGAKAANREIALVKMSGAAADHVVAVDVMGSEYLSVGVFVVR